MYTAYPAGYIVTQGPDGVPVAIPVQAGGGIRAVEPSGAQGNQPPVILRPVSRAAAGQPVTAQSPPYDGMPSTVLLPPEEEEPPTYAQAVSRYEDCVFMSPGSHELLVSLKKANILKIESFFFGGGEGGVGGRVFFSPLHIYEKPQVKHKLTFQNLLLFKSLFKKLRLK